MHFRIMDRSGEIQSMTGRLWKRITSVGGKSVSGRQAVCMMLVRIDHFIGIVRYYAIPADGVPVDGAFREGPGAKLIEAIDESIGDAKVIAEDLGVVCSGVRKLLSKVVIRDEDFGICV